MDSIADRVAKGVALLDGERPDWWKEIDLGLLEMRDCRWCVLGQLYGDFDEGKEALRIPLGHAYGFDLSPWESHADYPSLATAWTEIITARRNRHLANVEEASVTS